MNFISSLSDEEFNLLTPDERIAIKTEVFRRKYMILYSKKVEKIASELCSKEGADPSLKPSDIYNPLIKEVSESISFILNEVVTVTWESELTRIGTLLEYIEHKISANVEFIEKPLGLHIAALFNELFFLNKSSHFDINKYALNLSNTEAAAPLEAKPTPSIAHDSAEPQPQTTSSVDLPNDLANFKIQKSGKGAVDDIIKKIISSYSPEIREAFESGDSEKLAELTVVDRENNLICLICGKPFRTLGRHLSAFHEIDNNTYKRLFNLPSTYKGIAPSYSKFRSELAKKNSLGKHSKIKK